MKAEPSTRTSPPALYASVDPSRRRADVRSRAKPIALVEPLVLLMGEPMDLYLRYVGYLLLHGLRVAVAPVGPRGMELAVALGPDVVVIDLDVSDGDVGRDESLGAPHHALAVVNLRADDLDRPSPGDDGSVEFVAKPCGPERLLKTVLEAYARAAS
jgi:CheY-like chemotaxis protein